MDGKVEDLMTISSLIYVLMMAFIVMVLPYNVVLCLLALTLIACLICLRRDLIKVLTYLAIFVLPFMILTTIIQLASGSTNPEIISSYIARISIIYLNSAILVRDISMASLIKLLGKLNCELALSTAIAFKLLIDGGKLISELRAIYQVNLCGKSCSLRSKLQVLKSVAYAVSKLLAIEVLRIAEVTYIRYYVRICLRDRPQGD